MNKIAKFAESNWLSAAVLAIATVERFYPFLPY
jgi:hypothetical protein